jgi:hypothetical protein
VERGSAVLVRGGEGRRLRLRCVVGGLVSRSGPWYRDRSGKAVLYGTAVRAPHLAISLVDNHDSHIFSLLISDISAAARAQIEPTNNATAGIPNGPHGYKVHSLESTNPTLCTLSFWVFVDLPRCNEAVRGIRALWRGTEAAGPRRETQAQSESENTTSWVVTPCVNHFGLHASTTVLRSTYSEQSTNGAWDSLSLVQRSRSAE